MSIDELFDRFNQGILNLEDAPQEAKDIILVGGEILKTFMKNQERQAIALEKLASIVED